MRVLHLSAELQVFLKNIFEMQFSSKITLKTTRQPGDGFMTQLSQMTNQLIQVEEADFEDVGHHILFEDAAHESITY
jgi:hypothetical protein